MANKKWSDFTPANAPAADELVPWLQDGDNVIGSWLQVLETLGVTPAMLATAVSDLSGVSDPAAARTNLGLGDLATQNEADLPELEDVAPGTVENVLGVGSGAVVQQNLLDLLGTLQYIRSLTPAANKLAYFTGATGAALADFTAYGRSIAGIADRAALMTLYNLTYADIHDGTTTLSGGGTLAHENLGTSFLAGIPSIKFRGVGLSFDGLVLSSAGFSAGVGTAALSVGLSPNQGYWRVTDAAAGHGFIRSGANDTHVDGFARRGELPQNRDVRPTGAIAQTMSRWVSVGNLALPVSGTLVVAAVQLLAGEVVSSISWVARTTAGSGMTNQWFVLLDANRVVRAVSADDTSTAWAANAVKTLNMGAAYTIPSDGPYYLGVMVAGTTVPTLSGIAGATSVLTGLAPTLSGTSSTGQTTPPALAATMGAITASGVGVPYAYCS